jgi:hypothetical protein
MHALTVMHLQEAYRVYQLFASTAAQLKVLGDYQ